MNTVITVSVQLVCLLSGLTVQSDVNNQIRGLLTEYGIVLPQHVSQLRHGLPLILEDATNKLTTFSRCLFASLYDELLSLEEKINAIDEQIWAVYQASEPCRRIAAVEGIGPLIATALVAAMSDGKTLRTAGSSPPGWASYPGSIRVAGKRDCSASASVVILICERRKPVWRSRTRTLESCGR